jgi:Tol biopolymer transport system component
MAPVLFFAAQVDGQDDLFITSVDGAGLIRLTNSETDESEPAWRP